MLICLGARKLNLYTDFYGVATIQYLYLCQLDILTFILDFLASIFFC
jgi:hypothetical protein